MKFFHRFDHEENWEELRDETYLRMYIGHEIAPTERSFRELSNEEKQAHVDNLNETIEKFKIDGTLTIEHNDIVSYYKIGLDSN